MATGSVGIETMMFGFCAITVSMSDTCLSGLKPASVTAITSMPMLANCAFSPSICAWRPVVAAIVHDDRGLGLHALDLGHFLALSVTVEAACGFSPFGPRLMTFWPISARALAGSTAKAVPVPQARPSAAQSAVVRNKVWRRIGFLSLVVVLVGAVTANRTPQALASTSITKTRLSRAPAAGSGQELSSLQIQPE